MTFLNKDIIAVGATVEAGTVLLINKKETDNSQAKCCTIQDFNFPHCIDNIQKAITFNAFEEVKENVGELLIARLNRSLTDEQVDKINGFLVS